MTTNTCSPKLYVGTFAKYSQGSIAGAWIDLEGHDKESFLKACQDLHKDESDPELMFQDFEVFPREFYSECCVSDALFEFANLSDEDKELLEAYADAFSFGVDLEECTIEKAREALAGQAETEADFAEEYTRENGSFPDDLPMWLQACINWQAVWDSTLRFDFVGSNGFFFYQH